MLNPLYDLYRHEPDEREPRSNFLVSEYEHITKKGRLFVTFISFSQPGFMDQRCIETPQFVTNKMDIRGLHSAEFQSYFK